MKLQGKLVQFIHSTDNSMSLEKYRKRINAIVDDANVGAEAHS
jgi:hypothetical protein